MEDFLKCCIVITTTIQLLATSESKDAVDVIEHFFTVRSDIHVTASLPDLRHSHHTSLRLGEKVVE